MVQRSKHSPEPGSLRAAVLQGQQARAAYRKEHAWETVAGIVYATCFFAGPFAMFWLLVTDRRAFPHLWMSFQSFPPHSYMDACFRSALYLLSYGFIAVLAQTILRNVWKERWALFGGLWALLTVLIIGKPLMSAIHLLVMLICSNHWILAGTAFWGWGTYKIAENQFSFRKEA